MAMMECAHCGIYADARSMRECPACGGMVCDDCAEDADCAEGTLF